MPLHLGAAVIFQHGRDKVVLDIGCRKIRVGAPEAASLGKAGGHDPGPLQAVFDNGLGHLPGAGQAVADEIERAGLPAGDKVDMVLQVFAHCCLVEQDGNALVVKVRGWADARQHQHLRAAEGTCRQHHAAAGADHFALAAEPGLDADRAAIPDHDLLHQRAGADRQVGTRGEIGPRRRPALAALLRHLVNPEAILAGAVEVIVLGQLQCCRAGDKRVAAGAGPALVHDIERPFTAMPFVAAALIAL